MGNEIRALTLHTSNHCPLQTKFGQLKLVDSEWMMWSVLFSFIKSISGRLHLMFHHTLRDHFPRVFSVVPRVCRVEHESYPPRALFIRMKSAHPRTRCLSLIVVS